MKPYAVTRTRVDLTPQQVEAVLGRLSFLPGWRWETVDIGGGLFGIRVGVLTVDRDSGGERWQYGRTWWVEPVHSEADVVRTVFLGVKTLFDHELRELFTYDDRRVFAPHGHIGETPWPDL